MKETDSGKSYGDALEWYKALCESSNESFMPLYFDKSRYLVLMGGGGSGKSVFAARKVLERACSESGHRILICRKVARTLKESCFRLLCSLAEEYYGDSGFHANRSELYISFSNGSELIFAGLDDTEKLKSIQGITSIWIEEASEISESDFNQLDVRLRGKDSHYHQIIVSFNPTSVNHWLKHRFFDKKDPRATVHHSTYRDNRFLDEENIKTLQSFRDTDEYYYEVYCEGMWGSTGKSVFPSKRIYSILERNERPLRTGFFEYEYDGMHISNIRFFESEDGPLSIYREPCEFVPYVIGGDTAGDGSDFFTAQVIDNRNGEQVCTLRHRCDEDLYARQVYCLGMYYNAALIGIETNFSTYPTMELERLGYPSLYVRQSVEDYTMRPVNSYGFRTDMRTRPVIISTLISAVREFCEEILHDRETLLEMLSFVRNSSLRPEAEYGAHDDCVMALAIAHYIRPQQSYIASEPHADMSSWTEDMREDYENASAQDKKYLLKRWCGKNQ